MKPKQETVSDVYYLLEDAKTELNGLRRTFDTIDRMVMFPLQQAIERQHSLKMNLECRLKIATENEMQESRLKKAKAKRKP